MFASRLNSYQICQYVLIFCVSSAVIASQVPKKCAAFNEYCLNHWDCCSNSCMSYLYRCKRGYNIYPYPFLGVSYKPSVSLDQLLEQNFGSPNSVPNKQAEGNFASRIGGTDDVAATEVQIVLHKVEEETTSDSSTLNNPAIWQETTTVMENHLQGEESETHRDSVLHTTQAAMKMTEKVLCAEIGEKVNS